jgi:hypothetical protein
MIEPRHRGSGESLDPASGESGVLSAKHNLGGENSPPTSMLANPCANEKLQ